MHAIVVTRDKEMMLMHWLPGRYLKVSFSFNRLIHELGIESNFLYTSYSGEMISRNTSTTDLVLIPPTSQTLKPPSL